MSRHFSSSEDARTERTVSFTLVVLARRISLNVMFDTPVRSRSPGKGLQSM